MQVTFPFPSTQTVRNFRTVEPTDNSSESHIFLICALILTLFNWNKLGYRYSPN